MKLETLKRLNAAKKARKAVAFFSRLDGDDEFIVQEQDAQMSRFSMEANKAFKSGKSYSFEVDGEQWFVNIHLPPVQLVVIGAVHISQHLAAFARQLKLDIRIIDPRTAFATAERFGGLDLHADWPMEVFKTHPLDPYCALIAITHDPKIDDEAIQEGLVRDCFYVGALGSRKTHAKRLARLKELGLDERKLESIHAPIGLNIAASNPGEIALSILAQIVEQLRTRQIG